MANELRFDTIKNRAGTGAPSFPLGANITPATGSFFESGTFTPQIGGHTTAGTVTYTAQVGYYKKDGNKCHVEGYLITSSAITGSVGSLSLLNFPFLVRGGHLTILCDNLNAHSGKQIIAAMLGSALSTPKLLFKTQDVSDTVMPPISIIQNTSEVYFSGTYICE